MLPQANLANKVTLTGFSNFLFFFVQQKMTFHLLCAAQASSVAQKFLIHLAPFHDDDAIFAKPPLRDKDRLAHFAASNRRVLVGSRASIARLFPLKRICEFVEDQNRCSCQVINDSSDARQQTK